MGRDENVFRGDLQVARDQWGVQSSRESTASPLGTATPAAEGLMAGRVLRSHRESEVAGEGHCFCDRNPGGADPNAYR